MKESTFSAANCSIVHRRENPGSAEARCAYGSHRYAETSANLEPVLFSYHVNFDNMDCRKEQAAEVKEIHLAEGTTEAAPGASMEICEPAQSSLPKT